MNKRTVLVVDDEEVVGNLCAQILIEEGYDVTTVNEGTKAVEEAKRNSFDLLLTDLNMPGMSGLEVYQAVKKIRDEITTVVITGQGTIESAIESLKMGIEGFVLKPFKRNELINMVENALEKGRLIKENMRLKALIPLLEVNRVLIKDMRQDDIFDAIMKVALSEIKADRISIMLLDEGTQELVVRASSGMFSERVKGSRTGIGEGISGWVLRTGEGIVVNNEGYSNPALKDAIGLHEINAGMCVPLIIKGKNLGVINISKIDQLSPFTKGDLDLFSIIAGQLTVSLENNKLYEEIRENYFKTISALAAAIEAKDPYTKGHSAQVAKYAIAIAGEMGLSKEKIEEMHIAGILHDVGKIGIKEQVLYKPGKLTNKEYNIMKEHPLHGERILQPIGFSEEITKSIRHHHERYDGKGYPDGLKGEEIFLGARILCVADTIEAMTSKRYYRDVLSITRVIKELRKCSKTQFDPSIAEVALRLIEKKTIPV